jgi:hypothetical protein
MAAKDRCATCTRWRRGYREAQQPHAWKQNWANDVADTGACCLSPAVWTDQGWEQSRMHEDDWCTEHQHIELSATTTSEDVEIWMIKKGYATGHGDTIADMLDELEHQAIGAERKRCVDIVQLARERDADLSTDAKFDALRAALA